MIYIVLFNSPVYEGGLEKVTRMIAQFQSPQQKRQMRFVCCDPAQEQQFTCCGVDVHNSGFKRYGMIDSLLLFSRLRFSWQVYKYIKKNVRDGDIVNIHSGDGIAFFLCLLRKTIPVRFTIVMTMHGSLVRLFARMIRYFPARFIAVKVAMIVLMPYYWCIERLSFFNVDHLVTITKNMRIFLKKYYKINIPGTIIVNGMDRDTVADSVVCNDTKTMTALIVGSKTYLKGLDIAISAVKRFNETHIDRKVILQIVGFNDFTEYYDSKMLRDHVQYVGHVAHGDMQHYYKKADFVILPSRSEEFVSLVVLEALQHGKPFIVSRACSVEEMDGSDAWGYQVMDYKIDHWTEAIARMMTRDQCTKFSHNIVKTDFERYQWHNISVEYQKLFKNLV